MSAMENSRLRSDGPTAKVTTFPNAPAKASITSNNTNMNAATTGRRIIVVGMIACVCFIGGFAAGP